MTGGTNLNFSIQVKEQIDLRGFGQHSFTSTVDQGGKQPGSQALQIRELWYCHVLIAEGSGQSENEG